MRGAAGEEGTLFSMEAVEEGVALQEGDVEGIGQDLHPLGEDTMEEVEVLVVEEEQELLCSQEQEENPEEQGQGHARPVVPSDWPPLPPHRTPEALAVLQEELSCANEKYLLSPQVKKPSEAKVSLVSEKCHHPGHS